MPVLVKQRCVRCKKQYVLVAARTRFAVCYDCQKPELEAKVKDPAMRKLFDIPEDFYRNNAFLRELKAKYIRYGSLTEKQVAAFNKVVAEQKEGKLPPEPKPVDDRWV